MSAEQVLFATNTEDKSVAFSKVSEAALPELADAHMAVDEQFVRDPEDRINALSSAQFSFVSQTGKTVQASIERPDGADHDELLIMFAPFADRAPASSGKTLNAFLAADKTSWRNKEFEAKPHTWNQATKSAVTYDLLKQLGRPMPVLTIYSPIPTSAYTKQERGAQRKGDFSAAGWLAIEAVLAAGRHNPDFAGDTLGTFHVDGASLGASNAVGAAHHIAEHDPRTTIGTVTARELILGVKHVGDLANRFTLHGTVGESATTFDNPNHTSATESTMRAHIEQCGNEPIGMVGRTVKAMTKASYMLGLTHSEPTVKQLEDLRANGTDVSIALAHNSGLTEHTAEYVPEGVSIVKAVGGPEQKLAHLMNEYVALSASFIAYSIARQR